MMLGIVAPFLMTSKPEECSFLTERERFIAVERLVIDHKNNPNEKVQMQCVRPSTMPANRKADLVLSPQATSSGLSSTSTTTSARSASSSSTSRCRASRSSCRRCSPTWAGRPPRRSCTRCRLTCWPVWSPSWSRSCRIARGSAASGWRCSRPSASLGSRCCAPTCRPISSTWLSSSSPSARSPAVPRSCRGVSTMLPAPPSAPSQALTSRRSARSAPSSQRGRTCRATRPTTPSATRSTWRRSAWRSSSRYLASRTSCGRIERGRGARGTTGSKGRARRRWRIWGTDTRTSGTFLEWEVREGMIEVLNRPVVDLCGGRRIGGGCIMICMHEACVGI
ncbi:hypothetical protein MPH_03533 [Macrophomina phaseolina MS6]|uniref:Uncharacterized protein n=1 Tax=Macrophomina phaseolina (strain MS6) TaxID=1126212 RepID=K2RWM0_MACPH|nr:hypothetical protein MPH_03533 [Macrophomina phaseolina MS6]